MWPWTRRQPEPELRVLMVCTGNICRSPTAEAVLRKCLATRGLDGRIAVASAGTHAHRGSPPDPRTQAAAQRKGYDLTHQRGRQFVAEDFHRFGHILAMDDDNLQWLQHMAPKPSAGGVSTPGARVELLMAYSARYPDEPEVPDPYYGAPDGFAYVLELIEDACDGLAASLLRRAEPGPG